MELPRIIILDNSEALNNFKKQLNKTNNNLGWLRTRLEHNEYTEEMVHSIVNCFHEKQMAQYNLDELISEIDFGAYEIDLNPTQPSRYVLDIENVSIPIRRGMANAVEELGVDLLQKIKLLNPYDSNGVLLYDHYPKHLHERKSEETWLVLKSSY